MEKEARTEPSRRAYPGRSAAVDGPGALSASGATGTTFTGAVGATQALASLAVTGPAQVNGGAVATAGNASFAGTTTFGASTTIAAGGTLSLGANAAAGGFDLTLQAGEIDFASGITLSGRNLSFSGPMQGSGALTFGATGTLAVRGDLTTGGALSVGTPSLLVLAGDISSLGDLLFAGQIRVDGNRTITSRSGGDVLFQSTITGTSDDADSLYVVCSGLTSFTAAVGDPVRMHRLETDHPGTIRTAPSANAVIVIYGELENPENTGGGAALTQAYSAVWQSSPWIAPAQDEDENRAENADAGAENAFQRKVNRVLAPAAARMLF